MIKDFLLFIWKYIITFFDKYGTLGWAGFGILFLATMAFPAFLSFTLVTFLAGMFTAFILLPAPG